MIPPVGVEGLSLFDAVRRERDAIEADARVAVAQLRQYVAAPSVPTPPSVPCPTSEAAARAVETTGTAERQRDRILAYLRGRPEGATAGEIEAATGIEGSACRPRLLELSHGVGNQRGLGLLRRTEETRTVPGHRAALVWRIR